MKLGKIAVLMGGTSAERQVSLASGRAISKALAQKGHDVEAFDLSEHYLSQIQNLNADRVFIALHGGFGENGEIQALLEAYHLPYTGSGTATCALTMDKAKTKWLLQGAGYQTPAFIELHQNEDHDLSKIIDQLGLPLFVKPVSEGSSVGISKALTSEELRTAVDQAFQYDERILIETFLPGKEYTVSWLDGKALPSICIEAQSEFYDYDAKYITGTTEYHIPSGLSSEEEQQIQDLAEGVARLVGLDSWGRVDFIKDADGQLHVIEVNTVPGMTETSLVPKAAKAMGITFEELVEKIATNASLKNRFHSNPA